MVVAVAATMRLFALAITSLLACTVGCADVSDAELPQENLGSSSEAVLADGTPEALGVLELVSAPTTTVELLQGAGLTRPTATNVVRYRNGKDGKARTADDQRFDTLAELNAIPGVGEKTLQRLVALAVSRGLVLKDTDVLGVFDGVRFTVAEARATLKWVNGASGKQLDALALDKRAVTGLVAARPLGTLEQLSAIRYVGTAAVRTLKAAATKGSPAPTPTPTTPTPGPVDAATAVATLKTASNGLYHTSESDYPLAVFDTLATGTGALTVADVKTALAAIYANRPDEPTLAEREVESTTLDAFFDRYTVAQPYWEPSQVEAAPRWLALKSALTTQLSDVKVFRAGARYRSESYVSPNLSGSIDVFIVGRSKDGHWVGLWTISVET